MSVRQWFGGTYRDARDTRNFFARFAVRPEKLFQIYPELRIPEDQKEAFIHQRTACALGEDLRRLGDREIARWRNEHVGFIFQSFNLIPVMTAVENVELPLKLTNLKKSEQREHAVTALKLVGLGERLKHLPRQLSGGQEQRVAIARAIVTDPDLILADEPTGNLDAASAQEALEVLARLNREYGKTIIMVTHDPNAARYASKVRHLEKGILLSEGELPDEWIDSDRDLPRSPRLTEKQGWLHGTSR